MSDPTSVLTSPVVPLCQGHVIADYSWIAFQIPKFIVNS
jgi:hypothetical protein